MDLIFHFHKYFSPVAKKYLFEVKQILLTDLFVSHLAPFEFDMVTPLPRCILITRLDVAANKGWQLHADEGLIKGFFGRI